MIERILPGLWRVGGRSWDGRTAALTDDGSNCYLVRQAGRAALIDCGYERCKAQLEANIAEAGAAGELTDLLLTHSHGDHAEAAALWQSENGVRVAMSSLGAERIDAGDMRLTGIYNHPGAKFAPFATDVRLTDGQAFDAGGTAFTACEMPGHTPDSMLLVAEIDGRKVGFCGDVTFGRNGLGELGNVGWLCMLWQSDLRDYRRSLERMAEMGLDLLLPGHGETVVGADAAARSVAASLATVNHLLADPATRNFGMQID
jgi:glyoxylase-like metal-dependent hydrolase (beta-lactamase superfamily II)